MKFVSNGIFKRSSDYYEVDGDILILHQKNVVTCININDIKMVTSIRDMRIGRVRPVFKGKRCHKIETESEKYKVLTKYVNEEGKDITEYLKSDRKVDYKDTVRIV